MPPHLRTGSRVATLAAASLLFIAGCTDGTAVDANRSASAMARPAATPRPTPTPTRSPVPSRSPSPPPSEPPAQAAASAIDDMKIASPYALVFNPANPALSASFNIQVGSVQVTETMSGREIRQRGKTVGLVYVLELSGVPMSNKVFEGGAKGAAANTGGKLTYGKVLGHRVAYIVTKQASFAMYLRGEVIVMVGAETLSQTKTLLSAVIKSNK